MTSATAAEPARRPGAGKAAAARIPSAGKGPPDRAQRQRMTAAFTPEHVAELQQRAEHVSGLTPGRLAELHQQRQQLLPDGFP